MSSPSIRQVYLRDFFESRQKLSTSASPNFFHKGWSFVSPAAYAKQVAVKEMPIFFFTNRNDKWTLLGLIGW